MPFYIVYYCYVLLIKNITPSNLSATTCIRFKLRTPSIVLYKENVELQRNKSIEPLLGDSAESQLPGDGEPHYNSLECYSHSNYNSDEFANYSYYY